MYFPSIWKNCFADQLVNKYLQKVKIALNSKRHRKVRDMKK